MSEAHERIHRIVAKYDSRLHSGGHSCQSRIAGGNCGRAGFGEFLRLECTCGRALRGLSSPFPRVAQCRARRVKARSEEGTKDSMSILIVQLLMLGLLVAALAMWACFFPYPSPLVRRWLPPRKRWPEAQIRRWLENGRYHRAFLGHFYSDPERVAPPGQTLIAPADGLVTSVEARGGTRYLVIALSFWDMHVQRSPLAGRVLRIEQHGDGFMDGEGREFAFLREKKCPVQKRLVLDTGAGEVAVRLITSLAARRIETWVQEGENIERGQRIGRILLGSTVVLELPAAAQLLVKKGDRVWAGETEVAEALGAP